jgi:hypothetical protein
MTSLDDPRHGTYNGYSNLGCRCDDCKAANVAKMMENRERRQKSIDPSDPRHGTATFYFNYGCRCDDCKTANTEYAAKRRAEKRNMNGHGVVKRL